MHPHCSGISSAFLAEIKFSIIRKLFSLIRLGRERNMRVLSMFLRPLISIYIGDATYREESPPLCRSSREKKKEPHFLMRLSILFCFIKILIIWQFHTRFISPPLPLHFFAYKAELICLSQTQIIAIWRSFIILRLLHPTEQLLFHL